MNRQMAALVDLAYKLSGIWPHSASERSANEGRLSSVASSLLETLKLDRMEAHVSEESRIVG